MAKSVPPEMLRELRHQLALAISDAKAYEIPALCRQLNLADGSQQEAFASKYRYAQRRLTEVSGAEVIASARAYLVEDDHFAISEQVAKIDEIGGPPISTLTRRRLIALFESGPLATEVDDIELLRSVWPISKMPAPSQGPGYTLEDDILRHTVRNEDWSQRQLLETIGLLTCSRMLLFKFLAAVTAPDVQTASAQTKLAAAIDRYLRSDGYTLTVVGKISGSPSYAVQLLPSGSPADEAISIKLAAFDPTQVHARWAAALERRTTEPEGAITLARTLLEDVCKWILHHADESWQEGDDLPTLYRKLAKVLKLAPDEHTEQVFKQILGSCQSVVEALGSLRNKLSDAHSSGPKRARPHPRHAELAVNLSGAMSTFLVSTWEARQKERSCTLKE
ncbi:abortive infection family protein [Reyranella sp.]|uniref:abortive infection family protein n=1 Tax=Reyranella sp. TaxID=1929291 RepID=UPI003BAABD27